MMGHENLSLTQIVRDLVMETWPLHPFQVRSYVRHASDYPIEAAIDYDMWPCIYILNNCVFVVKNLEIVAETASGIKSNEATQLYAADPKFFVEFECAINKYLGMIPRYLYLP
jgi:hypothetical protein